GPGSRPRCGSAFCSASPARRRWASTWPTPGSRSGTSSWSGTGSTTPSATGTCRSSGPSRRTSMVGSRPIGHEGNTISDRARLCLERARQGPASPAPYGARARCTVKYPCTTAGNDKEAGHGHWDTRQPRRGSAGHDAGQEEPAPSRWGRSLMDRKRYFRGPCVAVRVMLLLYFIVFTYANRGTSYTQVDTSKIVSLINSGQVNEAILTDKSQTIQVVTK